MEKKRGRPKKFSNIILLSFNIEREDLDKMNDYCKSNTTERGTFIIEAIKNYLNVKKC